MKYRVILLLTLLALLVSIAPLAAQDATECEDGSRMIEHVAGTDCIPETVERGVVFDTGATELMLALNRPPMLRSVFLESFQLAVLPEMADEFMRMKLACECLAMTGHLEAITN